VPRPGANGRHPRRGAPALACPAKPIKAAPARAHRRKRPGLERGRRAEAA
jgi:hypothetical protein